MPTPELMVCLIRLFIRFICYPWLPALAVHSHGDGLDVRSLEGQEQGEASLFIREPIRSGAQGLHVGVQPGEWV